MDQGAECPQREQTWLNADMIWRTVDVFGFCSALFFFFISLLRDSHVER